MSIIGKYAEGNEIKLGIHDISERTARKKARKKGIWRVPVFIIGQHRSNKLPFDEKSLIKILKALPDQ